MQKVRSDTSAPVGGVAARSRGRPRGFDREAALLAATLLFWRRGYSATSISDLTEAMGIGSPSLYAAFGSKEALYAEALAFYGERYGPRVWARFSAAATVRDAVEAYLMDSAASLARGGGEPEPPGCMVMLSAVGGEGCTELGALVSRMRDAGLRRVEARLERGMRDGELPAVLDGAALARFLLAVQSGMAQQARDGATRAQLEGVARTVMASWDGLTGA